VFHTPLVGFEKSPKFAGLCSYKQRSRLSILEFFRILVLSEIKK